MKKKQILCLFFGVYMLTGCAKPLESIQLHTKKSDGIELGDSVAIQIETNPMDVQLESDAFRVTGQAKMSLEDHELIVTPQKSGTYQVTASQDGVTSNTLILTVQKNENQSTQESTPSSAENPSVSANRQEPESQPENPNTVISWSQTDPLSVDEVISHAKILQNSQQSVWMQGEISQDLTTQGMVLYNDVHSAFVSLDDPEGRIHFSGPSVMVVGKVMTQGNSCRVIVERAYAL